MHNLILGLAHPGLDDFGGWGVGVGEKIRQVVGLQACWWSSPILDLEATVEEEQAGWHPAEEQRRVVLALENLGH